MKKIRIHFTVFIGVSVLLFVFFAGWEIFYPRIGGGLFTYTRNMIYAIYSVLTIILMRVYGACHFGRARIPHLIYSQFLSEIISAAMVYVVGVANSRRFVNPFPILLIIFVQLMINVVFSVAGNSLYYRINVPKRAVVLYKRKSDLDKIKEIEHLKEKFIIEKYIENPEDIYSVIPEIEDFGVVLVTGIEATLRNGIAKYCIENGISGYIYPHIGDIIMMNAEHMQQYSTPLVRIRRASPSPEYLLAKRIFDIAVSLIVLMLTSIIMAVTAIAIKSYDGGPVLYKQVRLTKDGKRFKILKFRSMRTDAEKDSLARLASENDDRITPVGKVIRACRIDELPQLFNILKGDMSIVGPRPERPEIASEYEKIIPAFSLRLQCKAGLTGYAQVYGRYNTEPTDKLKMDLMYIHNMNFLEDIKLCFYTVKILFMKESTKGVAAGQITAADKPEKEDELDEIKEKLL